MKKIEKREALASLAHTQWAGWMRGMFGKCRPEKDFEHGDPGRTRGALDMPDEHALREPAR